MDIDGIQAHGIGAADITKLKANGFYTVAVKLSHQDPGKSAIDSRADHFRFSLFTVLPAEHF